MITQHRAALEVDRASSERVWDFERDKLGMDHEPLVIHRLQS
jgi:hypothetical protein